MAKRKLNPAAFADMIGVPHSTNLEHHVSVGIANGRDLVRSIEELDPILAMGSDTAHSTEIDYQARLPAIPVMSKSRAMENIAEATVLMDVIDTVLDHAEGPSFEELSRIGGDLDKLFALPSMKGTGRLYEHLIGKAREIGSREEDLVRVGLRKLVDGAIVQKSPLIDDPSEYEVIERSLKDLKQRATRDINDPGFTSAVRDISPATYWPTSKVCYQVFQAFSGRCTDPAIGEGLNLMYGPPRLLYNIEEEIEQGQAIPRELLPDTDELVESIATGAKIVGKHEPLMGNARSIQVRVVAETFAPTIPKKIYRALQSAAEHLKTSVASKRVAKVTRGRGYGELLRRVS